MQSYLARKEKKLLEDKLIISESEEEWTKIIELTYRACIKRNKVVQKLRFSGEKNDEQAFARGILEFMAKQLSFIPARIVNSVTERLMSELPQPEEILIETEK